MIDVKEFSVFIVFSVIAVFSVFVDMITGIIAARYEGHSIRSLKFGLTINKILAQVLYFILPVVVIKYIYNESWLRILLLIPIILTILREYISIGENMGRRYNGKMPYLFKLLDKIFDIFENKFFKVIERKIDSKFNIIPDEFGSEHSDEQQKETHQDEP